MHSIDSTAVDSVAYGVNNILANDGGNIALSGILIVFLGLILISFTIFIFNRIFLQKLSPEETTLSKEITLETRDSGAKHIIPADHLAVISAAIELYRRLHFDFPESKVTFERGEDHSPWKTGHKFGQR